MLIDHLRERRVGRWRVTICQANYRPERRFVEIEDLDVDDPTDRCAGFSDTPGEAEMLFDTVVRSLLLSTGADCVSVDWMELPDGVPPLD